MTLAPALSLADLHTKGFAVLTDIVGELAADNLCESLAAISPSSAARERNGSTYAVRNLLRDCAAVRCLADSDEIRALLQPVLGRNALAVRGILFDKTPGANWKVPWHQDLSIAVRERRDIAGFGPWSIKCGIPHVQPPPIILESMLTVRLHLDRCEESNGPLMVLPGSHAHGILNAQRVALLRRSTPAVPCTVPRGGAVIMRPLLLHASSVASSPEHRRVVHIEFAAGPLPGGLEWFIA